ncbi:MAG: homoserine dehydrogenase [Candidatus Margulisbacteria bacterium]|nr:homoserine dehydrogenase [Candidatus Margulisiibacteriota bacterium]
MSLDKTETLHIAMLGLGHVGQGVCRILSQNKSGIETRIGKKVVLKSIFVRNTQKYADIDVGQATLTSKIEDILEDPDIDIMIEVMGGERPAYEYVCKALKKGKHVITANKEMVCKHKNNLFKLAKEHDCDLFFEAAVAGGIPIIRCLKVGFAANKIHSLYGILNGTTNYILTQIESEKKPFDEVLKEAQRLGFAEADPEMDISGLDIAYKLVILAAVGFKVDISLEQIQYEGIEQITSTDIAYANELGYTIRMLAIGDQLETNQLVFKVHPMLIPQTHPLASVKKEFNALFIKGDFVGETMLYGKGAGGLPTGSSIVSDMIDIAFGHLKNSRRNLEYEFKSVDLCPISETSSKFYLRLLVKDEPGVIEKIGSVFGKHHVSILKFIQKDKVGEDSETVVVTHLVKENHFYNALKELNSLNCVIEIHTTLRVGLDNIE